MWILIISLVAADYHGGSALASIGGFKTARSCEDAAQKARDNLWQRVNGYASRNATVNAICVWQEK